MLENLSFDQDFKDIYTRYNNDVLLKQLLTLDGISPDKIDVASMSKGYFTKRLADVSIDQNANANEEISPNNYQAEVTKGELKLNGYYLLWKKTKEMFGTKTADRIINRIWVKDVYFHDASSHGIQTIYCVAFSTFNLLIDGRPYGQLHSLKPKRADSFMAQAIETIMDMSNTVMGAVAPADLIVNYAYFAKKEYDNLIELIESLQNTTNMYKILALATEQTEECVADAFKKSGTKEELAKDLLKNKFINSFQKLVHIVNNKYRVSGQSPFVNISLYCRNTLRNLFEHILFPDGSEIDIEFTMWIQKIFGEFFAKGDPKNGQPYRFPVVTVNINVPGESDAYTIDHDFKSWVSQANLKTGVFNIYVSQGNKIAMCCRYSNDITAMRNYKTDTFGNGGLNIGSSRVITLNLPRIAILAENNIDKFYNILDNIMEDIKIMHIVHRAILKERVDQGFIQFIKPLNWLSLDHFFATVGIIGDYEMIKFMSKDIKTKDGQVMNHNILEYIDQKTLEFTNETRIVFNVEEIPGESTAPILAKADRAMFGDTVQPYELYSNQYLPLIASPDIFEKLELSGMFMKTVSGGGIAHINMSEGLTEAKQMEYLIDLAIEYGVTHFAINYGFGICGECEGVSIVGNGKICPICGGEIADWLTRIIGYFVKVSSWHKVRKDFEFPHRSFAEVGQIRQRLSLK
jgi:anaerobic ribonucleoside-triphosphate reductase